MSIKFSPQRRFVSKTLAGLILLFLLGLPGLSYGQYLLDTFQDDPVQYPPNGPEIGSAAYGGNGAYHSIVDMGADDLRLNSYDSSTADKQGILISYTPIATSDIMRIDFDIQIGGGATLGGINAFSQELTFSTSTAYVNIFLYWGNDKEFRIRTIGAGVDKTIDEDHAWEFNTDYHVTVYLDLRNNHYWVYVPVMGVYEYETFVVDAVRMNALYFSSTFSTKGSQIIDNVTIQRGWGENLIWYVDDTAAGANNGQNWTDAFTYLQNALTVAKPGDEIWVAQGTYKPDRGAGIPLNNREVSFRLRNEIPLYGGFNGAETIRDERDWRAHETILSGEIGNGAMATDNSFHVVYSASNDATAVLDGFTISGGYNVGETYPGYIGAGMLIRPGGEPTVSNCLFTENDAGSGGALGAWNAGSPSFFNCIFLANTAAGTGGAVSLQYCSPIFLTCMFLGNSAQNGGAIDTLNTSAAPICNNCIFSGNSATNRGGAVNYGDAIAPAFPIELINCSLNENTAGSDGGGIFNSGDNVSLNSCILWNNADQNGSGETSQIFPASIPPIQYSCIMGWTGGWGGPGNIGTEPLFVDPDGLDDILGNLDDNLRLQATSPCIDTGDPNPLMNDSDGTRNDMGAYGGPGAEIGGIGTIPGSGFLFTDVGNIPRSEITQDDLNPNLLLGTANVAGAGLGIPAYVNTPFGSSLWLHGLFGADNMDDIDYYQVLAGAWDGATPPDPLDPGDWVTLDDKLVKVRWFYTTEWEHEYVTIGPREIDGVEDLYLLTPTPADDMWSRLTVRIIWNTRNFPNGIYTLTVKAYDENPPGTLTDITASLGDIAAGELILRIDNSPVSSIIHNVKYDPSNPYYIPADDGEIKECSIINLTNENENLRFTITASHPHGYLRQFTLDNIYGKNQNGGVIAQEVYFSPPPLWNGVTNQEFQSQFAPNPPGNLQPWRRCAYQFRLRVWPRITDGFWYLGHREFNDHYFLDLPGALDCSVYDIDNNSFINMIDFAAFAQFWLKSCIIE